MIVGILIGAVIGFCFFWLVWGVLTAPRERQLVRAALDTDEGEQ